MRFSKVHIKCFLTVCFVLLLCSFSQAQYKIRLGFGISDIAFQSTGQSTFLGYETNMLVHDLPLFAFEGGISSQFDIGSKVGIIPELLLSKKGVNYNTTFLYDDIKYQLHYIWIMVILLN